MFSWHREIIVMIQIQRRAKSTWTAKARKDEEWSWSRTLEDEWDLGSCRDKEMAFEIFRPEWAKDLGEYKEHWETPRASLGCCRGKKMSDSLNLILQTRQGCSNKVIKRWNKPFKSIHLVNWVSKKLKASPRIRILSKMLYFKGFG